MGRRLKLDIPGHDWRVGVDEVREKGWERLFAPNLAPPLRLVLEIGFGRGEFLMDLAAKAPDVGHVGVEYSRKRVLKVARRLARTELRNVRLVHATGEQVVGELLARESLETVWMNFPDPWPKKRHHRRRLIQPPFVHQLAICLRPGGVVHVVTDHAGYAEVIGTVLAAEPLLANVHAPLPYVREASARTPTAYELEWRAEGREFYFWAYRRVPFPTPAVDGAKGPP